MGAARIPRLPSANPIPARRVRGRRVEGLDRNGSLDQSGLEGAGAPRARSRARRATGHGARGRTGRVRSPGGAGRRCAAPSAAHSRALPRACGSSADGTGPRRLPTDEGGLQTHMHFAEGCLRNSASRPASLATLRTRAFPEVTQKRQKGNGPPQPAGISTSHDPGRGNPRAKLRTRAPGRTEVACGQAGRSAGVERPRWRCPPSGSCRDVRGGGEVALGPVGSVTPR